MSVRDGHWSEAVAVGSPPQFLVLTFYFFRGSGRLRCEEKVKVYTSGFAGKNQALSSTTAASTRKKLK
jgi:hypothetical protein